MVIAAEKQNADPTFQNINNHSNIISGTDDEVLVSILSRKPEPLEFIKSVMSIVRKNSNIFNTQMGLDNVMQIVKSERDAADAAEEAKIKTKIEVLVEKLIVRKDGCHNGALDFIDFAMNVVRKKSDLFKSEKNIDSIMRIIDQNTKAAAEMETAKSVLANILESVMDKLIQTTYASNFYSWSVKSKNLKSLEEIRGKIRKLEYLNSEGFRLDIYIKEVKFLNFFDLILDAKADEIKTAEIAIKKAMLTHFTTT